MGKQKSTTPNYTGINIQWPISQLILSGEKTVETRTYPIPEMYIGKKMVLIETPGKYGKFKARAVAIIEFEKSNLYKSQKEFYRDQKKHCVTKDSLWAWKPEKPKWAWPLKVLKVLETPVYITKRTGIKYTKNILIDV